MGSDKINNALVAGKAIKKTILIAQSSVCEKLFVELDACILLKFGRITTAIAIAKIPSGNSVIRSE